MTQRAKQTKTDLVRNETDAVDKSKGGETDVNLFVSEFIPVLTSGERKLEGKRGGKHHFDEKREAPLLVLAADLPLVVFIVVFIVSTVETPASRLRTSDCCLHTGGGFWDPVPLQHWH